MSDESDIPDKRPIVATRAPIVVTKQDPPRIVDANPFPDNGNIDAPIPLRRGRPRKFGRGKSSPSSGITGGERKNGEDMPHQPTSSRPIQSLLDLLANVPNMLPETSYEECGNLINALSKAIHDTAIRRRQAQEQLEAGTQRAKCETCGGPVDLSKSGGFQMLTVRDEYFQPKNIFYCSQTCIIARNLPSLKEYERKQKQKNVRS